MMKEKCETTRFDGVTVDTPPLPDGRYRVILADPPWSFKTYSKKNQTRSAENHYPVMSLDAIKALPVSDVAHPEGSVLFLWITDPFLKKGIETMEAWGWEYKTVGFTWIKTNAPPRRMNVFGRFFSFFDEILYGLNTFFMGTGYYTRSNPEMCLIGTRGKTPPRKSRKVRQLVISPRREHSRKPDEVNARIEELFDGPYLEMFCRRRFGEDWDVWGNETDVFEEE